MKYTKRDVEDIERIYISILENLHNLNSKILRKKKSGALIQVALINALCKVAKLCGTEKTKLLAGVEKVWDGTRLDEMDGDTGTI